VPGELGIGDRHLHARRIHLGTYLGTACIVVVVAVKGTAEMR
jgi:hypothetical protein